jgi:uncharacterized protein YdhG (YjbR/CyaY superfamily)
MERATVSAAHPLPDFGAHDEHDPVAGRAEVDAWSARLPPDQRRAFEDLRARVLALVPDATERLHYRVPTVFHDGPLVALNATRTGLALITMRPGLLDAMRGGLRGVAWSGSTLHSPLDQPLPDDVLQAVIHARLDQNARGHQVP